VSVCVYVCMYIYINMLAISRLYDNISFAQLAELLGIEPTKVDTIWATMYIDIDIDIDWVKG